jgi:hypothetical protein
MWVGVGVVRESVDRYKLLGAVRVDRGREMGVGGRGLRRELFDAELLTFTSWDDDAPRTAAAQQYNTSRGFWHAHMATALDAGTLFAIFNASFSPGERRASHLPRLS